MNIESQHISSALIAIAVPFLLGWMIRSAKSSTRKVNGVSWLYYGKVMKGFAIFFVLLVLGLVILWFNVAAKDKIAVLGLIALFGSLTLPLVLEFFLVRVGYDSEKIYCHSPWRSNRVIAWSEVESVNFSQSMKWWVIDTRSSGKVRVPEFMSGLRELLVELEGHGKKNA